MKMRKLISFMALCLAIVLTMSTAFASAPVMKDVDYETDLGKSIDKLIKAGVINGIPEADGTYTYRSENAITRAEFCKMVNATFGYGIMDNNIFTDVTPDKWYYVEVLKAVHYGYIKGYGDGRFGGEDLISREQVCVILDRIIGKKADKEVVIADEVSDWALSAVRNIVCLGYMPLEEGNTFRATENMTRGEHAQTLDDFVTVPEAEDSKKDENKEESKEDNKEDSSGSGSSTVKPGGSGNSSSNSSGNGNTNPDPDPVIPNVPTTDQEVENVISLIGEIGVVTLDSKTAIEGARSAYAALSQDKQSKVTNYSTLTSAEARLASLERIEAVIQLIDSIGEVTLESVIETYDTIKSAREAYNALNASSERPKVTNRQILFDAEKALTANDIYEDLTALYDDLTSKMEEIPDVGAVITIKQETDESGETYYQLYNFGGEPVPGGPIIMMLLQAAEELIPLKYDGFVITSEYVRDEYATEIEGMKYIVNSMTAADKEAFEEEIKKLNTGVVISLGELFEVNWGYGGNA